MPGVLAKLVLLTMLAAVPPLTDAQRTQLDSARDTLEQTDEVAIYPLLENAMLWPANSEAGASIPDYAAIQADPAAHRGQLFLIEGIIRRARPIGKLALPGPWDGTLSEWVIQWGDTPEQMLVVNLVAPPGRALDGTKVRLAARFYKLWVTTTTQGEPRTYMVFVGRDAKLLSNPTMSLDGKIPVQLLVIVICVGVGALYWVLRRRMPGMSFNPRPTPGQLRRQQARTMMEQQAEQGEVAPKETPQATGPPLPKDPASALAELETRQKNPHTDD